MELDLKSLPEADARLLQVGLQELGFYAGTTQGRPGRKTLAAYRKYLKSLEGQAEKLSDLGNWIATLAEKEIGVREVPKNSNRGKRVEEYQAATWLDGTGWPWCAAFVCWCIREAEKSVPLPFKRPRTAGAWDLARWGRGEGLEVRRDNKMQRGDVVIFTFSHVGIASGPAKRGVVPTIEGNTNSSGSREGGGVYAMTRKTSLIKEYVRIP